MDRDDHLELLMELVTLPHWVALKREVGQVEAGLLSRLMQPVSSLEDLVRKEGYTGRMAALRQLIADVEEQAKRYAKQLRD